MNQTKTIEKLNQKWTHSKECECCGADNWSLSDKISSPMHMEGNSIALGGSISPQITVVCNNCGNIKLFNAIILGLMKTDGTIVE